MDVTDELAKVLHDAARDSLLELLSGDEPIPQPATQREAADFLAGWILDHLRFGERMALTVEMARILRDLTTGQTISIPVVERLLERWQEMKP